MSTQIKLTRTFTRPTTDVQFWVVAPATKAEINDNYVVTNKILSVTRSLPTSTDLTQVIEYIFASDEALEEFRSDASLSSVVQERDAYNATHGIATSHVIQEVTA